MKPRLRFDRVALGLLRRLRDALQGTVPHDRTIAVTVTAPIRQASKTATAIEERIRKRLRSRSAGRSAISILGNRIQIWVLKGGTARTSKLVGFVHNPDTNPVVLIELTRALLAAIGPERRAALRRPRRRWLVIDNRARLVPLEPCRNICAQLRLGVVFEQILVSLSAGRVEKLSCR